MLKTVLPDVDLDDPKLAATLMQRMDVARKIRKSPEGGLTHVESSSTSSPQAGNMELLEFMVDNTGLLDLDDESYRGFHGHSSGLVFLRRIRKRFGDLIENPAGHGLPSPNKRRVRLNDTLASSNSSPVASEAFSQPGHTQNGGTHSQQFICTQEPNEKPGYYPSASRKVTTFDHGASSRITDDYLHLYPNNYLMPADAVGSSTLLRAHSSGPPNATQPILTTSQNFASTGFAGISAMMFPSADPFAYPMQPMSSIENSNSMKLEDRQDSSCHDTFSTVTESGASTQLVGAYALHLMPGQKPDVSAEAQYMHPFSEKRYQKSSNHIMVPTEAAGGEGTYHQPQPNVSQAPQGMNFQHLATAGWSPAWIHRGS